MKAKQHTSSSLLERTKIQLSDTALNKLIKRLREKPFRQRGVLKNLLYGLIWVMQNHELPQQLMWVKYVSLKRPIKSTRLLIKIFKGRIESASLILHLYGEGMLRETLAACNELGLKPFLAFGTLLGHIREGGFIEHDSDIDLGLMDADYQQRGQLVELLKSRGYTVRLNTNNELSFLKPPFNSCCCVDFFRFCLNGKGVTCAIEDWMTHKPHTYLFSADVFEHFTPAKFMRRVEVLIPAGAEKFLVENYGDWRTPKPDFDIWRDHLNEIK
jgi:hypothetical protein